MKDIAESAQKTVEQLQSMSIGSGYDALLNSSKQLSDNLKKQLELERQIAHERKYGTLEEQEEDLTQRRNSLQRAIRLAGRSRGRIDTSEAQEALARVKEELDALRQPRMIQEALEGMTEGTQELYNNLKRTNPVAMDIVDSMILQGATAEQIIEKLIDINDQNEKFLNFNKDLVEGSKMISEGFDEIRFKDMDNDFTKIGAGFEQIRLRIEQLPDAPSAMQLGAVRENLEQIGSTKINTIIDSAIAMGIQVDSEARARLTRLQDYLTEMEEINLKISTSENELEKIKLRLQRTFSQIKFSLFAPKAAKEITELAEDVENAFISEKTDLAILKMQTEINKAILEQQKTILTTTNKIVDMRQKLVGINIQEDKFLKSITTLSRNSLNLALTEKRIEDEIAAIRGANLTLIIQQKQAQNDKNDEEANHIGTMIAKNNELAREKKAQLEAELSTQQQILAIEAENILNEIEAIGLAKSQNSLLKDNQNITLTTIRAEEIRLQNLQKQIQFRREEQRLLADIAGKGRQLARVQAQGRAAQMGFGGLSAAQEREFKRADLQAQLKNIEAEKALLEQEKQAALDKLTLENELFKIRFAAAEQDLVNAIDTAKSLQAQGIGTGPLQSTVDALDSMRDANVAQTLQDRYDTEKSNIETIFELKNKAYDAEGRLIQATIDNLGNANTAFQNLGASLLRTSEGFNLPDQTRGVFLSERQAVIDEMATGKLSQEEGDEKIRQLREQASAMGALEIAAEGVNNVLNTVQSSMEEAFMSMIDGSKSAAEAFGDMAKAILKDIAQMIVKMLVYKAIEAGLNMIPGVGPGLSAGFRALTGSGAAGGYMEKGAAGGIMGYANGGIIKPRDGLEGIVKQPTYLVGEGRMNEAVVPLPNGRSIPVQMHGGNTSSQQNNVSVTVNMGDGSTTTNAGSGDQAQRMGQMIAAAVQKELMAQKSPGGLLSKYG